MQIEEVNNARVVSAQFKTSKIKAILLDYLTSTCFMYSLPNKFSVLKSIEHKE